MIRMIGLISMLPMLGRKFRIRESAGSVMRYRKSPIVQTTRLRVSSTPNAISMLNTAARITAHLYRSSSLSTIWKRIVITRTPP